MVVSLKANKKRILAILIIIAIVIGGFIIVPKLTEAPVKYYGETATQRLEFINSFGYAIADEPIDVRTVTVPKEFNEIYTKYNVMQTSQGFDLKPYKGKECKQYIYLITNYPGTDREIHITLLVYEGIIIGGDVSCAEIDGFMHGFAMDSARYGEEPSKEKTESSAAESTAPESSIAESSSVESSVAESSATEGSQTMAELSEEDEQYVDAEGVSDSGEEEAETETVDADYPTD